MISSICLTGRYNIVPDGHGKFTVNDNKLSLKEVPFVRYRFDRYNEKDIEYINKMKELFKYSSHLVELTINENIDKELELVDGIENIIKYLYIPVDNEDVLNGISDSKLELIEKATDVYIDRVMLKDNSTNLDVVASIRLKKDMSAYFDDIANYNDIGVCQSPLSFDGNNACLTAVRARELSAEYAENDMIALPSSNHECMNTCGCIRYIKIENDIVSSKTTSKQPKKDTIKDKKPSVKKKTKGILKW